MGFFDKLFGRNEQPAPQQSQQRGYIPGGQRGRGPQDGQLTDEQAIARYRYMLQTAPPETIEQAHEEAFSQLTPEQRRVVLQQLSDQIPAHERAAGVGSQDDPKSLARMATRAEMRQPGTLERTWSAMPVAGGMGMGMGMGGIGMGGLIAGSFLSSMAGMFVGSMIANQFFGDHGYNDGFAEGYQAGEQDNTQDNANDQGQDNSDAGSDVSDTGDTGDYGSDYSSNDIGGGDYYGGDVGGDFGGGDFGGGDFG